MFRGKSSLNMDSKGRLAIPSRYRARLQEMCEANLVATFSPNNHCVWIYPLPEWEVTEAKLIALPDFNKRVRQTKVAMLNHAEDCTLDSQGRIRLESSLIEHAGLVKEAVIFGQGNKFELWNEASWNIEHQEWLDSMGDDDDEIPEALSQLSL